MKVICIKKFWTMNKPFPENTYKSRTTIGKTYELFQLDDGDYYFIDDYGDKPIYFEKYFVTQEQWRDNQINKILYENTTNCLHSSNKVEIEIPKMACKTKSDFL